MSIIRMATIPGDIYRDERLLRRARMPCEGRPLPKPLVRRRGPVSGWQRLLVEAYPAVGLILIAAYLIWALFVGEYALPWVNELSPAE